VRTRVRDFRKSKITCADVMLLIPYFLKRATSGGKGFEVVVILCEVKADGKETKTVSRKENWYSMIYIIVR
jgi:hypothetical protein